MSVTGVMLWELLSTYRHRTTLRTEGKLPAARPRFGLARWIWFRPLTRLAWLLALRDGYTTTNSAWRAALRAVELYGSAKDARRAVRAGRPVPRPEPLNSDEQDEVDDETADQRDAPSSENNREVLTRHEDRDSLDRDLDRNEFGWDEQPDAETHHDHRDNVEQDTQQGQQPDRTARADDPMNSGSGEPVGKPDAQAQPETAPMEQPPTRQTGGSTDRDEANLAAPTANPDHGGDRLPTPPVRTAGGEHDKGGDADEPRGTRDRGPRHDAGEQAVSARMLAYARQHLAEGVTVTGADLDRRFGTRDYGRKVLRRLAAESQAIER